MVFNGARHRGPLLGGGGYYLTAMRGPDSETLKAQAAAKRLTERPRATADDWALRAQAAFNADDHADATAAGRRARQRSAKVQLTAPVESLLRLARSR